MTKFFWFHKEPCEDNVNNFVIHNMEHTHTHTQSLFHTYEAPSSLLVWFCIIAEVTKQMHYNTDAIWFDLEHFPFPL